MIHRLSDLCNLTYSIDREMHSTIHHGQNLFQLQEVLVFCRAEWISFKEQQNCFPEIVPLEDIVGEQVFFVVIVPGVAIDTSALEELSYELEGRNTSLSLHDYEPRLHLPSAGHAFVPLDWTAETTFTVDEADDPLLESWPFLLIVRTERIFTAHVLTLLIGCDTNEYLRILGVSSK